MSELKKMIQKAGPARLAVIVLCGVFLVLISYLDFFSLKNKEEGNSSDKTAGQSAEEESGNLQKYQERIERELSAILENVQGVGRVEVMITLRASNEKVTLKDNTSREGVSEEETVLIEDSDRNSSPYVLMEKEPELEGVVVVCDGGGDAVVKREITEAVSALFDVEPHKIKIMKSREAKE